ncbi:hypothetical protein GEMRC1_010475 [Eukaryota sp. GEM-RC1]
MCYSFENDLIAFYKFSLNRILIFSGSESFQKSIIVDNNDVIVSLCFLQSSNPCLLIVTSSSNCYVVTDFSFTSSNITSLLCVTLTNESFSRIQTTSDPQNFYFVAFVQKNFVFFIISNESFVLKSLQLSSIPSSFVPTCISRHVIGSDELFVIGGKSGDLFVLFNDTTFKCPFIATGDVSGVEIKILNVIQTSSCFQLLICSFSKYLMVVNCELTNSEIVFLRSLFVPIPKSLSCSTIVKVHPSGLLIGGFGESGKIRYFLNSVEIFSHESQGKTLPFQSNVEFNDHHVNIQSCCVVDCRCKLFQFSQQFLEHVFERAQGKTISDVSILSKNCSSFFILTVSEDFLLKCSNLSYNDNLCRLNSVYSMFGNFRCISIYELHPLRHLVFLGSSAETIHVYEVNVSTTPVHFKFLQKFPSKKKAKSSDNSLVRVQDIVSYSVDSDNLGLISILSNGLFSFIQFNLNTFYFSCPRYFTHSMTSSCTCLASSFF